MEKFRQKNRRAEQKPSPFLSWKFSDCVGPSECVKESILKFNDSTESENQFMELNL